MSLRLDLQVVLCVPIYNSRNLKCLLDNIVMVAYYDESTIVEI